MTNYKYTCGIDPGNGVSKGALCVFNREDNIIEHIQPLKTFKKKWLRRLYYWFIIKKIALKYKNVKIYEEQ